MNFRPKQDHAAQCKMLAVPFNVVAVLAESFSFHVGDGVLEAPNVVAGGLGLSKERPLDTGQWRAKETGGRLEA